MSYIYQPERLLHKNQNSGYAGLDSSGNVDTAHLGNLGGTADATTFLRGDQTWATPAGGSGSVAVTTKTFTDSPYNILSTDYFILGDTTSGAVTLNLPDASSNSGKVYIIKKMGFPDDVTPVTYVASGTDAIDYNDASGNITMRFDSVTLISDGLNYWNLV